MTFPHAIYGSATGLGDFGILAATPGLDERVRSAIVYHASLEGSARSTPFAPIFSFYAIGDGLWAFARTRCLGPTRRGNDYIVHAIVLDADALAAIDHRPFALADASLFVSEKPAEGAVLKPLLSNGGSRRAYRFDNASIASCVRALSRGPLRIRAEEDAVEICREIHESLPPDDRMATTFCTRESYGRNLGFRLAAFARADEMLVRENAPDATLIDFPPPPSPSADLFDRSAALRGGPELDLVGLSIIGDVRETFALVDSVGQLRRWKAHDAHPDMSALQKASALVLRRENRGREVVQSLLPGALAVDLAARVRSGTELDECARRCSGLTPEVRRAAVRWLRDLKTTPAELWMAEMLLLVQDAPLADIADGLRRMQAGNANVFRAFATTILGMVRERFGAGGAPVAAAAAPLLAGDRDALLAYVRVMEEIAAGDRDWLLAIVRDVFVQTQIAAAIPARIILSNDLLGSIDDHEIETFAPAFFLMDEKLAGALASTRRPALDRALAGVAEARLREGWTPATPAAAEVLRRVLGGAVQLGAPAAQLTILAFLGAPHVPAREVAAAVEHVAAGGVTEAQAALLIRTLQTLGRRGAQDARVGRGCVRTLLEAARRRPPANIWNRLGWYLRVSALTEIAG